MHLRLGLRLAAAASLGAVAFAAAVIPSAVAGADASASPSPGPVRQAASFRFAHVHADGTVHVHGSGSGSGESASPDHVDPAPPGVDVTKRVRTDELLDRLRSRKLRKLERAGLRRADGAPTPRADGAPTPHADGAPTPHADGAPTPLARAAAASPAIATASGNVPPGTSALPGLTYHVDRSCLGDGSDGNRVQVLYVVEEGQTDRFTDVLPVIRDEIANVDDTFALSAAETGGGLRMRWVFDPATCEPVVTKVVVPAGSLGTGADPVGAFGDSVTALEATGRTDPHRKYLFFSEGNALCGIGHVYDDPRRSGNPNDGNAQAMFARVDTGCWQATERDGSTAAHELMHNIGGVQTAAAHSTPFNHCTDDYELMCYADGSGATMQQVCPLSHEPLFDCGHDDYFNTNPPAGSYLADYWNTADSSFLDKVGELPPPPTVTVTGDSARPGLPVTLTATGSTSGGYLWTVTPSSCPHGANTSNAFVVQCPTNVGSVTGTVTFTGSDGQAVTQSRTLTLGGPAAPLTTSLTASSRSLYVGQSTRLTASVRSAAGPVLGVVTVFSSPDKKTWTRVAGPVATSSAGLYAVTVKLSRTMYFKVTTSVAAGSGWTAPASSVVGVAVAKWPSRVTMTGRAGRPDVLTGRVLNAKTGAALARTVVTLQTRPTSTGSWRVVTRYTTGSTGYVTARVQPRRLAYYRWVYGGTANYAPSVSTQTYFRY